MPRPNGEALGAAYGRPAGGAAGRERQPVAQNCTLGTGKVDSKGVEEGLWVCGGRQRHGVPDRLVYRW